MTHGSFRVGWLAATFTPGRHRERTRAGSVLPKCVEVPWLDLPRTTLQGEPAADEPGHAGIEESCMAYPTTKPADAVSGGAFGFIRNGYDRTDVRDLTTTDLEGASVYGREDETIGSISELQLGTNGNLTHAVIDVGGFLGMGVHSVLVPFAELTILRATDGSDVRVHFDSTKDKLKAMPHHAV
jgi:hypothetical protein